MAGQLWLAPAEQHLLRKPLTAGKVAYRYNLSSAQRTLFLAPFYCGAGGFPRDLLSQVLLSRTRDKSTSITTKIPAFEFLAMVFLLKGQRPGREARHGKTTPVYHLSIVQRLHLAVGGQAAQNFRAFEDPQVRS